jgi:hypothetical protein
MIDLAALTNLRDAEQYSDIALYVQVRERLAQVDEDKGGALWDAARAEEAEEGLARMTESRDRGWQLYHEAQAKANATPAPPARKLREYKGVMYNKEQWWYRGRSYVTAAALIDLAADHTDDDHAPLMSLKADPYLPLPDVRAAVREIVYQVSRKPFNNSEVDAAVTDIMNLLTPERAS